jgi:adenine/guanine phosphoribosyltransferase-like PRPP-binding protein
MDTYQIRRAKFLWELYKIGAIRFVDSFIPLHDIYSDAPKCPFEVNFRPRSSEHPGPLEEKHLSTAARLMRVFLYREKPFPPKTFRHVAGIPEGGTALAEKFCEAMFKVHHCWVEFVPLGKIKEGDRRRISGEFDIPDLSAYGQGIPTEKNILLVDDTMRWGETKLEAAQALGDSFKVIGVLALVDLEWGGRQRFEDAGYKFLSIYTLTDILTFFYANGCITEARRRQSFEYGEKLSTFVMAKVAARSSSSPAA